MGLPYLTDTHELIWHGFAVPTLVHGEPGRPQRSDLGLELSGIAAELCVDPRVVGEVWPESSFALFVTFLI